MRVTAVPDVRASAICSMFLYGAREQVVPRRRRLQVVLLQELVVGHEHERIVGDRDPQAVRLPEALRQPREGRRLVGLEQSFVDPGREGLDRAAEQHVDPRVALLRRHPRERLARREAHEVDLDAGRLLEFLEHRPRPVLRPDRVDVDGLLRLRDDRGGGEHAGGERARGGGLPAVQDHRTLLRATVPRSARERRPQSGGRWTTVPDGWRGRQMAAPQNPGPRNAASDAFSARRRCRRGPPPPARIARATRRGA